MSKRSSVRPKSKTRSSAVQIADTASEPVFAPETSVHDGVSNHDLDRVRQQWQIGDWPALAALAQKDGLADHPYRSRLMAMAAVGAAHLGDQEAAHKYAARALQWGCSKQILAQALLGSATNLLGRAALLVNEDTLADDLFAQSMQLLAPRSDHDLSGQTRGLYERIRLGFLPAAADMIGVVVDTYANDSKRVEILRDTIAALLHQAEVDMAPSDDLLSRIAGIMDHMNNVADPLSFIAKEMKDFEESERVHLAFAICDRYLAQKNRMMALDSLADAQEALPPASQGLRKAIARRYFDLGETWQAVKTLRPDTFDDVADTFAPDERKKMQEALTKGISQSMEHGHSLLLSHLEKILPPTGSETAEGGPSPVLVEVGTTRERVPGQGSTAKIAAFCKERGIHMITVDMDPRNGALARQTFERMGTDFEAVTDKGEDFLSAYKEPLDYVFLDAYDFDHGKHSELRQSRYEAFLGSRIDEEDCHRMHLKCAEALVDILASDGVICIDDTWLDEAGAWTAKGKLAVPFLLQSGFYIIEARDRAILMGRTPFETPTPHI